MRDDPPGLPVVSRRQRRDPTPRPDGRRGCAASRRQQGPATAEVQPRPGRGGQVELAAAHEGAAVDDPHAHHAVAPCAGSPACRTAATCGRRPACRRSGARRRPAGCRTGRGRTTSRERGGRRWPARARGALAVGRGYRAGAPAALRANVRAEAPPARVASARSIVVQRLAGGDAAARRRGRRWPGAAAPGDDAAAGQDRPAHGCAPRATQAAAAGAPPAGVAIGARRARRTRRGTIVLSRRAERHGGARVLKFRRGLLRSIPPTVSRARGAGPWSAVAVAVARAPSGADSPLTSRPAPRTPPARPRIEQKSRREPVVRT